MKVAAPATDQGGGQRVPPPPRCVMHGGSVALRICASAATDQGGQRVPPLYCVQSTSMPSRCRILRAIPEEHATQERVTASRSACSSK